MSETYGDLEEATVLVENDDEAVEETEVAADAAEQDAAEQDAAEQAEGEQAEGEQAEGDRKSVV